MLKAARTGSFTRTLTVLVILVLLVMLAAFQPEDARGMALLYLVVACVCLAVAWRMQPDGAWAIPSLSLLVLVVFHAGALPEFLIQGEVFTSTRYVWGQSDSMGAALWASLLATVAFTAGSLLPRPRKSLHSAPAPQGYLEPNSRIAACAVVVLMISVGVWIFRTSIQAGLNPISSSYSDYLNSPAASDAAWLFQPIGIAFALSALGYGTRKYEWAVCVFTIFAAFAFFSGYRGETLFALVAHVGVLSRMRQMPKGRLVLVGSVVVLGLTALARVVRQTGVAGADIDYAEMNPLSGLSELGFSHYVVEWVFVRQLQNEVPLALGETFVAPLLRLLDRFLGNARVDGASDDRLFNVLIQRYEGPVGGSVIGEAAYNFGTAGAVLILFAWGFCLAMVSRQGRGAYGVAVAGIVAFSFLWHVRNASTPLLLLLSTSLACIGWLWVSENIRGRFRSGTAGAVRQE